MRNVLLVIALAVLLAIAIAGTATAQRPEVLPPPLPGPDWVKAPPGATPTPRPDEARPFDITGATVTPIPFKEVIDRTGGNAATAEHIQLHVLRANGDYVLVITTAAYLEKLNAQGMYELISQLGLGSADRIVNVIESQRFREERSRNISELGRHKVVTPAEY